VLEPTSPRITALLQQVRALEPDIVTLDIEMPEMNGLEALGALRKEHARLPIIMFSTLTVGGGKATLDALSLGASDFVTKPSGPGGLTNALARTAPAEAARGAPR